MFKIAQAIQIITGIFTTYCTMGRSMVLTVIATLCICGPLQAGDAAITEVVITPAGNGSYRISVTLLHDDTGWDHYANRWDVLDEEGNLLGSRELLHPHVNEQPFTRSLQVEIPDSVKVVTIVAADSVHGDNKETVTAVVPKE